MENTQDKHTKFTDWSKHVILTEEQRKKLIAEKLDRARIQYLASKQLRKTVLI